MKKVIVGLFLALPLMANANSLQQNSISKSSHHSSNHLMLITATNTHADPFDSVLVVSDSGITNYLGGTSLTSTSSYNDSAKNLSSSNFTVSGSVTDGAIAAKDTTSSSSHQEKLQDTSNQVPFPAALPLMLTAVVLFGFGANRSRV